MDSTDPRENECDDEAEAKLELNTSFSCSLTEEETSLREHWIREQLLPHLTDTQKQADGYTFVFERTQEAFDAVTEISWKESQCCSWAAFEIELPRTENKILWQETSPNDEANREFFHAIERLHEELE